jgi:hypothetical protein
VRLRLVAMLARARIPVQVEVGFGDAVVPGPEEVEFPVLLDFPAPRLKAYARETSVAEKFEALVKLGMLNTRMKDFYDLWELSRRFDFDGATLCRSIKATFERRGTPLPTDPRRRSGRRSTRTPKRLRSGTDSSVRGTSKRKENPWQRWRERYGRSRCRRRRPPLEMRISAGSGKPRGHGFQPDLGRKGRSDTMSWIT